MKDGKMTRSEAGRLGQKKAAATNRKRYRKLREDYEDCPTLCETCRKPLTYEKRWNKFCGQSCSARKNNTGVRRHGKETGNCLHCGLKLSRSSRVYCSNRCQRDYEWKLVVDRIEETGEMPPSNRKIRKYLVEKFGVRCWVCGATKWRGKPVPLEVDHINGLSDDNRTENVRMVCGNCGMQLPTYKGRNVGNGRWKRRQRYAEGKSY